MCSKKEECWTLILSHQVDIQSFATGFGQAMLKSIGYIQRLTSLCLFTEWRDSQSELEKVEESQNGRPEVRKMDETPPVVPMQVTHTSSLKSPIILIVQMYLFCEDFLNPLGCDVSEFL